MTTGYQAAGRWVASMSELPLPLLHPAVNYSPAPFENHDSTGTRELLRLVEKLSSSCGSGSWCDAAFSQLEANVTRDYFSGGWLVILLPSTEAEERNLLPTIAEKLNGIRDAFGLSMAALADVLKASRASVYNWFENEPRGEKIVQRIETLYEIAQEWDAKNPYHYAPGKLMKQKLGDGPSMFDRLCREELDFNEIRNGIDSLLALMTKQRERMDRTKERSAKIPADTEGHRELLERLTGSVTADK